MIICISGLAGSGKTTVAHLIEENLSKKNVLVKRLNSDMIADRIFIQKYFNWIDRNIDYSTEELQTIYNTLFFVIEELFSVNKNLVVITDGMYRKTSQRLMLELIAQKLGIEFVLIKTEIDEKIAKERLLKRNSDGGLGGWVDPNEYEEPARNYMTISNNNTTDQLKSSTIELMSQINNHSF